MAMAASDTGWSDMPSGSQSANTPTTTNIARLPHHRPRSYPETDWEERKQAIKYLFLDLDMPLPDVVEALSADYDFHTNERMCKTRLKRWGFEKNMSKHRPSTFRDKRPVKSRATRDRIARRLGSKTKKTDTPVPGHLESIEETMEGLPGDSADHIDGEPRTGQGFNSEANSGSYFQKDTDQAYEEACPYRHGQFKFRLMQDLGSGAIRQTDMLSDGSRVDVFDERLCSPGCPCRRPYHFPSAFAFLACVSDGDLEITMLSSRLRKELVSILPEEDRLELKKATFSGLVLLKHFYQIRLHPIRHHLNDIDLERTGPLKDTPEALLELELLVAYLLSDCDIISTLGYEQLHNRGFLSHELWQYFQEMKLQSNIDRLDSIFWEIDQSDSLHLDLQQSDSPWTSNPSNLDLVVNTFSQPQPERIWQRLPYDQRHNSKLISELTSAVSDGQIELVRFVLNEGCAGEDEILLYINRAVHEGLYFVVQTLLNRLVSIDKCAVPPYANWLYSSARRGHYTIVRLLLNHGAGANEGTLEKPLLVAASKGHWAVVRLLLDRGTKAHAFRWQALFASSDRTADLNTYRDAVKSMWGVELDDRADISADINVLGKFQSFANSLAARARILWDDALHAGHEPMENRTKGGGGHDYRETAWGTPPLDGDFQPAPPKPKPPDPLDRGRPAVELVVAYLIASVAFAIFLIFLQVSAFFRWNWLNPIMFQKLKSLNL
ncbi:rolling pebbles-like protein [Colletotrichum sojae]|uniref:Rolling pebbles-like protein n=1 Tax=Colletotrichum sojae TaxID=2175907 RepID=A0A8H6J6W1_9PEZI|nr:rolling pebbles-like protein [Colletotrichum sojae]